MVTLDSIDLKARTVTLDANGTKVTRTLSDGVDDGGLKSHLLALASGLEIEFPSVPPEKPVLTASPFKAGETVE